MNILCNCLRFLCSLVDDTKRLVSSAGGTQEQLAEAATKAVDTIQSSVDLVKRGASSLTSDDVEAQVSIFMSCHVNDI